METVGSPLLWGGFIGFVAIMLALDLGVFNRHAHVVRMREALGWSVFWIALALCFNWGILHWFGRTHALEFLTGYLIEKALSVDNLFVFLVIFSYFNVPPKYQHRILFWGIVGALILRAFFIVVGAALLTAFHWIIYVFGGFLVLTGIKLLGQHEAEVHPERNPILRLCKRVCPLTIGDHGGRFLVKLEGKWHVTTWFLVLAVVETTDVIFAVDSIPAIFAITKDPFIVFTSNIFAILGLRALFFLLAGAMNRFVYLKYGLGLVLVFVGAKMLISGHFHIPIGVSLGAVGTLIGGSIIASLLKKPEPAPLPHLSAKGESFLHDHKK